MTDYRTPRGNDPRPKSLQPTCAERIAEHMAGRAEDIGELLAIIDNPETDPETMDSADERLAELPLSIEIVRHVKILLSTGGPADWLDATLDSDGSVIRLRYVFEDWFDHADMPVPEDSALWRYAESMAEMMDETYAASTADAIRGRMARERWTERED